MTESAGGSTQDAPVKCIAVGCLTALADKVYEPRRDPHGVPYLLVKETGERLPACAGKRADLNAIRAVLGVQHRAHYPAHADPSEVALRRVAAELCARAAQADRDAEQDDRPPAAPSGPKTVLITGNPDGIRKIRQVLLSRRIPETYVMDGRPTTIERVSGTPILAMEDDAPLPVASAPITGPDLARMLAHHLDVQRSGKDGWSEWTPPQAVLAAALSGREWPGLPPLTGFVGIPVVRPDGTLMQQPGYDPATGLYLAPTVRIPAVPPAPTPEEVQTARTFVLERLLGDFPFRGDADRANYVGLMVSPYLRRYTRCVIPLGFISASMPGSGKTLLAAMIGQLAGQLGLPWSDDDYQLKETITSTLTIPAGVLLFDNVPTGTTVRSPILATLLTSETWSSRMLGGNKIGSFQNDRLWLVTGNNLRTGEDIARRAVAVWLEPDCPHPETRTGFAAGDLTRSILKKDFQAEILGHLLTMVVDWTNHGAPKNHRHVMGNFTAWAADIGGFLDHHGIGGFLANASEIRTDDADEEAGTAFLRRWLSLFGDRPQRVKDVHASAEVLRDSDGRSHDQWEGDFVVDERGQRPRSVPALGALLKEKAGRWRGETPRMRLVREHDKHADTYTYRVETYAREILE